MRKLLLLAVAVILLTGAAYGYTYTVALGTGESEYIFCATGGDLEYAHPLNSDGTENRQALVVVCPMFNSPLAAPSSFKQAERQATIFLPVVNR